MLHSSIQLREAAPSDLNAILSIFVDCIDTTAVNDYSAAQRKVWKSSAQTPEKWLKRIEEQTFLLACEDEHICGFASLEKNNYIDCMYVSPQFQHKGIARILLDHLETLAKAQGCEVISSDISHTAKAFFEKNGFQVVQPNRIEKDGVVLVNFRMEKSLSTT